MQKIICIYDKEGKSHYEPRFTNNVAQMTRDFIQLVCDEKTQINKFPEQFCLMELGTFDETTGEIKADRKTVIEAVNCIRHFQPKEGIAKTVKK